MRPEEMVIVAVGDRAKDRAGTGKLDLGPIESATPAVIADVPVSS